MKVKKIKLISNKGVERVFIFEHALTLLQKYKTWALPEDSQYKFENNDIVKRKPTTGDNKETSEKNDD